MKKIWTVLGGIFLFISLWLSMFVILSRVRLLGLTQTPGGLGIYMKGSDIADRSDAIGAFFLAVVIAYIFYVVRKRNQA